MTTAKRKPGKRKPRAKGVEIRSMKVQVRWADGEYPPPIVANQVFLHAFDGNFTLTFGYAELPYELPYTEETLRRIQRQGVVVRPVTRIVVPHSRLEAMLEVMNDFMKGRNPGKATGEETPAVSVVRS